MFNLLSLNQLLAGNFYHKSQKCNYGFKKPIGISLLFNEIDPENTYQRRELRVTMQELFNSQELEFKPDGENSTTYVYNYFENQYNKLKKELGVVKTSKDLQDLLALVDPFSPATSILSNIQDIKLSKKELFGLLEEDWVTVIRLKGGQAEGSSPQAESSSLYSLKELKGLRFSLIDLDTTSQPEFAEILEKAYYRSEVTIHRGAKDNLLPFFELFVSDYINIRVSSLAGELEITQHKVQCQIEPVNDVNCIGPEISGIFSSPKAAIARFDKAGVAVVFVLLGMYSKIDEQNLLLKIKIELPQKSIQKFASLMERLRLQKNPMNALFGAELYSGVYSGIYDFLSNRGYKIKTSSKLKLEVKKKIEKLLKSPQLTREYQKMLHSLGRLEIQMILSTLAEKKQPDLKEITLVTIRHLLKEIADSKNFHSDLNFIKTIKHHADSAKLTFLEEDWAPVVAEISTLMQRSSANKSVFFILLEHFFEGSIFLTAYGCLSELEADNIASTEDEFSSLCIKLFDHNNWVKEGGEYTKLNPASRTAVINFIFAEIQARLSNPDNLEALKKVRGILNRLNIVLSAEDLKPFVVALKGSITPQGSLTNTSEAEISGAFEALSLFFCDLPHAETYAQFAKINMAKEWFSDSDYVGIGLNIFDDTSWLKDNGKSVELNQDTKDIIKEFIIKQVICLLPDDKNREKTSRNRGILDELSITLKPDDILSLIEAINSSPLCDHENKLIKNGEGIERYFETAIEFLCETRIADFYHIFLAVNLGQYNYANYDFVTVALSILDHKNWNHTAISENTSQEIKQFYFHTFLDPKLHREHKISNLDILHNRLKISITANERNELSKYVKGRIEGLVDLVDAMEEMVVAATD